MKFAATALAASVAIGHVAAISSGCTGQLAGLAFGDVGSCLQLTSLLPLLNGGSGSIVTQVNTYLGSLCASSTPTCSNSSLTSAQSSIQSGCSSDLSSGGADAQTIQLLLSAVQFYPQIYSGACSKNSTTGEYCLTSTLNTVQQDTGSNITFSFIASLASGSGADSLQKALGTGNLCTGCVANIYHQATTANATIASGPVGQAVTSQCGANFGAQASQSGVSASAVGSATSGAASSAAATTSRSAASPAQMLNVMPMLVAGGAVLSGLALGSTFVL